MSQVFEWATQSGDSWARRWRDIDRALVEIGAELDEAIAAAAPQRPFRAFDIGCGAGSTSLQLATARPDASILACDLSPALAEVARSRLSNANVDVRVGDAEEVAETEGPFDLFFSRHGVMFFSDPEHAFRTFRAAAAPGASLIFSCFQDWQANPWASELASAAAGRPLPPPGREPSGFAFAEPDYVRQILTVAGWSAAEPGPAAFHYVAGEGADPVGQALAFLTEIGPASSVLRSLAEEERAAATQRMRRVLERHCRGNKVEFDAAAWIWTASEDLEG